MLPKWTALYIRDDKTEETKELEVYGETVFQAWYNAMCAIQIIEKTESFTIKGVNPKKSD